MDETPNILLIITDHQAFYGHNRPGEFEYVWPRFEAFCAEGVRFDRAYSICPICTPARSSMMTGLYPSRHGLIRNTDGGGKQDFDSEQQLYSHYLAREGYRNAYVGKWHCGHSYLPVDYGIEGWSLPDYGKVYMCDAYEEYAKERGLGEARARIEHNLDHPEWAGQTLTLHHESPWHFMNGSGVLEGPPEAHEEPFVAHLTVETLKELAEGSQPWSLVASFWGPHQPYFPTEPFASMVDPETIPEHPSFRDDLSGRPLRHHMHRDFHHTGAKEWKDWAVWQHILARAYGQGLQTDAAVGQVLDALAECGAAENTIVIWCSDHGDALASHGGLWDKASTFTEEVTRVPLAVRWPAGFTGNRSTNQLVSNMDVTATMLDAAGIPVPKTMDSRSLLPLCDGNADPDWPDEVICEHNGHGEDIVQRIVIHDKFKYVAALYDGDEMYNLTEDPYELHNLVGIPEHRVVKADLRQRIIGHIERTNDRRACRLAYSLKQGF
ncbi:MAG: sulfatase-like hydrolase/transferase [Lentisphaerae bacterium]|nr:sulfatase-like hydrolase/transferase [Lentisphaerota bacterium]